jgi:hypothetical protein
MIVVTSGSRSQVRKRGERLDARLAKPIYCSDPTVRELLGASGAELDVLLRLRRDADRARHMGSVPAGLRWVDSSARHPAQSVPDTE